MFNDWHKQGLTHKECLDLIAEYNKVTGYVYSPKKAAKTVKGATKPSEVTNENLSKQSKSKGKVKVIPNVNSGIENRAEKMAVIEAHKAQLPPPNRPINQELVKAQIQAIKDLRKEGLLTVEELTQALKALQA